MKIKQAKDNITLIFEDFGIGVANQNIPLLTKDFLELTHRAQEILGILGLVYQLLNIY